MSHHAKSSVLTYKIHETINCCLTFRVSSLVQRPHFTAQNEPKIAINELRTLPLVHHTRRNFVKKITFFFQNCIDLNSTTFFKKRHIKIKFSQKLPRVLLIIVLLDTTEPFLLMDKLAQEKHLQLQEVPRNMLIVV